MALNHTNTGAEQRKSRDRTPALTRTTHGPLKSEYSVCVSSTTKSPPFRMLSSADAAVTICWGYVCPPSSRKISTSPTWRKKASQNSGVGLVAYVNVSGHEKLPIGGHESAH